MSSRYVLHEVSRGQYRFTLTSHTGQVLLTSGFLMDKESALRKIDLSRFLARNSRNYEFCTAENGSSYFLVRTAQAAINLVKSNTRGARLEDLSEEASRQERPVPSGRFAGTPA